ncbi:hypothetical protein MMC24_004518 [Lignoscripta atroalba]|nr:hypothetical protein [Lignoscripta atroalba]
MAPREQVWNGRPLTDWSKAVTITQLRQIFTKYNETDSVPKAHAKKAEWLQEVIRAIDEHRPRLRKRDIDEAFGLIERNARPPSKSPKAPAAPKVPAAPKAPTAPKAPAAPKVPAAPNAPAAPAVVVPPISSGGDTATKPIDLTQPGATVPAPQRLPDAEFSPDNNYGTNIAGLVTMGTHRAGPDGNADRIDLANMLLGAAHASIPLSQDSPRRRAGAIPARSSSTNNLNTLATAFNDSDDPGISFLRLRFLARTRSGVNDNQGRLLGIMPTHSYILHPLGRLYPYRGRGPVWANNSCGFDCCLVVSRLLDVGRAIADVGNGTRDAWLKTLSEFERSMLEATDHDWDLFTPETSIRQRHDAYRTLINQLNSTALGSARNIGNLMPATAVWDLCTSMANQFSFSIVRAGRCTSCLRTFPRTPVLQRVNSVTFDALPTGPRLSMQQMLQRHFGATDPGNYTQDRGGCNAQRVVERRLKVAGTLPVRLVVKPDTQYRYIRGATADQISFSYMDTNDEEHQVTYRWLGGIYLWATHYRVYWTDCDYMNQSGHLKVYDGKIAFGSIVGGVQPDHSTEKIPQLWELGTDMLFYERVNENNLPTIWERHRTMFPGPPSDPELFASVKLGKRKRSSKDTNPEDGKPLRKKTKFALSPSPSVEASPRVGKLLPSSRVLDVEDEVVEEEEVLVKQTMTPRDSLSLSSDEKEYRKRREESKVRKRSMAPSPSTVNGTRRLTRSSHEG